MQEYVIVHYGEIGLKGRNRDFFERILKENIQESLKGEKYHGIKRVSGRFLIILSGNSNNRVIKEKLKIVFGISYFAFAYRSEQDIKKLSQDLSILLKEKKFLTFKIDARRANLSNKSPFEKTTSQEINSELGDCIRKKFKSKVDLGNPKLTCFVEIVEKYSFIYFNKIKGIGGLPVGVSGKVVSLISSGIDSPVASWQIMRRGARVVFVHFHSYPYTSGASQENAQEIVKHLTKFQHVSSVYFIPFGDAQKKIIASCPSSLRVVLYRRIMMATAEKIALNENALALVTGENLGQVASQTLENIFVISDAVSIPVFRPLIGLDKNDIIKQAKQIGTYNMSIRPYEDCCSFFMPQNPATKADLKDVKKAEEKIKTGRMINQLVKSSKLVRINK